MLLMLLNSLMRCYANDGIFSGNTEKLFQLISPSLRLSHQLHANSTNGTEGLYFKLNSIVEDIIGIIVGVCNGSKTKGK